MMSNLAICGINSLSVSGRVQAQQQFKCIVTWYKLTGLSISDKFKHTIDKFAVTVNRARSAAQQRLHSGKLVYRPLVEVVAGNMPLHSSVPFKGSLTALTPPRACVSQMLNVHTI